MRLFANANYDFLGQRRWAYGLSVAFSLIGLAVDEGFKHAMSAIIDSNVTTVLTALFLFQFGTGPVKGFAVTLILGIAASMVTAIFVTRTMFMVWLDRKPTMATLSI